MNHESVTTSPNPIGKFRTICFIHRLIYDGILNETKTKEEILELLEEAFSCGLRMNNKLLEYSKTAKKKKKLKEELFERYVK